VIVIDASIALSAAVGDRGFTELPHDALVAPPLLWPEVRSALHEAMWRGEVPRPHALDVLRVFEQAPIQMRNPGRLSALAWEIADRLGWAKTHDAEYLALAELLDCQIATLDGGIRDAALRLRIPRHEL
jgi:predicted nucleic acid-binding protein